MTDSNVLLFEQYTGRMFKVATAEQADKLRVKVDPSNITVLLPDGKTEKATEYSGWADITDHIVPVVSGNRKLLPRIKEY